MSSEVLAGLRVADLSTCVAGQFAGRLFADNGADVVLVDGPDGNPLRRLGPFDEAGGSLLFRHLSTGKAVSPLTGDALLADVAAEDWDVVLLSDPARVAQVSSLATRACVAVVTDFADQGPYASWAGGELIHQALSGSMYYNGRAGRTPLYGTGHRADYAAGFNLYTCVLARLLSSEHRIDAPVRVTRHESAVAMEQNFSTQWIYSHTLAARGEWNRPKGRVRCRDGWLMFFASDHNLRELFTALDAPELADDPRFAHWSDFIRNIATANAELNARAGGLTQDEALHRAVRDKLVLSPVRRLADLAVDEQLVARDFWSRNAAGQLILGPVWRQDPTAPTEGAGRSGPRLADAVPRWTNDGARPGPLTGVRVVDLTSAWSGPMTTRMLAALGAEVIKIEGPNRMDGWRGHHTTPWHLDSYPDSTAGVHPYNRNAWFNTQNQGKLSVGVDLKRPGGREVVLDLVAQSDLIIANYSPGTLSRLGLGIDDVRRVNPEIVVVEMSGFGDTGPLRDHRGLGQTMEAMSGIASLIGYPDEDEPLGSGSAYLDPMGGLAGAAAALTALTGARRSGSPHRVELPQREAALHWIGEQILDAIERGVSPRQQGNDRDGCFPHGAYQARGDDEWVAVATYDDEQWRALCTVLGWHDWAADSELAPLPGRLGRRVEIERRLAEATRHQDKDDFAARLQGAGVPAAPVQNGPDLCRDPQLRARSWFTATPHAEVGRREHPGVPVEIDGRLSRPRLGAPLFAEHTATVLSQTLGYPPAAIADLLARGVVVVPQPDPAVRTREEATGVGVA